MKTLVLVLLVGLLGVNIQASPVVIPSEKPDGGTTTTHHVPGIAERVYANTFLGTIEVDCKDDQSKTCYSMTVTTGSAFSGEWWEVFDDAGNLLLSGWKVSYTTTPYTGGTTHTIDLN